MMPRGLTMRMACVAALLLATDIDFAEAAGLVRFAAPWTSPYRVDPKWPYHFVNAEGHHLLVMNKTAWAYFGCKDPEAYLERAKRRGSA